MKKYLALIVIITLLSGCASLKPNPRPWTNREKAAAGFFLAGHTLDAFSTEAFLDKPGYYELNPIMGEHPSDRKVIIYFSITGIIALAICHLYPKLRAPVLMTYGGINWYWALHNYSMIDN